MGRHPPHQSGQGGQKENPRTVLARERAAGVRFVICHLLFVICHLSFVICHSSFVIRHSQMTSDQ
ncbi:MAG: hypothetical protein D6796_16750 [Caldilineae bacterium]|nr:MAG: hypothetical protein D6796_16750 [Caldilineae bacterium]